MIGGEVTYPPPATSTQRIMMLLVTSVVSVAVAAQHAGVASTGRGGLEPNPTWSTEHNTSSKRSWRPEWQK